MKLYFFRHAQAEDAQGPEFDDFTRRLTQKGEERTEAAGRALMRLGVKPAQVFTSPRVRARQTADILAKVMGLTVTVRDEVNFGFNPGLIAALVEGVDNEAEVLIVGHEPDLSSTTSALIGGGEIVMKKGGVARVDLYANTPPKGALVWVLGPRVLDELGGAAKD